MSERPESDHPFKPASWSIDLPRGYNAPTRLTEEPLTRRRSVAIALGLLGATVAGYAAFGGKDVQRNSYASLEDCEHDYATGQCTQDQPVSGSGGGHSAGYHYYGPWYRSDWRGNAFKGDPGPGRTVAGGGGFAGHGPTGFDFGSRGGFGSSGRVSARGG
ncbi:hypothetical protein [Luteibacter sp. 9133]|uniref:hypothetical protein n=1 Tax=Luteibacter sp. 9133 TaxID=1500891 RepID=UPI0005B8679C|nr:hypothetical protein [Luteibacter sp. 9133]